MFAKLSAYRFKYRILFALILLNLLSLPTAGAAADQDKVVVLPFKVNAPDDLNYLSVQIATVMADQLKRDGAAAATLGQDDLARLTNRTMDAVKAREVADQYAAQKVIWGSFTLVGSRFSLDARMADIADDGALDSFSEQGEQIENLLNVIKQLTAKIELKLFQQKIISDVSVQGHDRIEADAILRLVEAKPGAIYKKNQLSKDLQAIFKMGYFDDLRVEAEETPEGMAVIFHVKEKPTIRRIKLKGNLRFEDEEIKENMTLSTGAILNIFRVQSNIEQIESMYKEKNYHQIKITYNIQPTQKNQADIQFVIEEGKKIYVTSIRFDGNDSISDKKLKKVIQTSEKGFFSWLTSSGDMDRDELDQDAALLKGYYHTQGYTRARVADPVVDVGPESIEITFRIDEGPRFKVRQVDIAGDLILDRQELAKSFTLKSGEYFNREKLRNDVIEVRDIYGSYGYAYAEVNPRVKEDLDNLVVDVTYVVDKRQEVYFENIFITGNSRTRDKVIRRQLRVKEQGRFDTKALKRSIRNLYRLDYFEDTKVNTQKGSADDKMVLNIDVTEKSTGQFSFGAGLSSEENLFLMGSISERNLFGRGQILRFNGEFGSSTTRYSLSFTEPWLFDIPLSGSVSGYKQEKEYDEYDRNSFGAGIGVSYPIFDYTRLYWNYAYDHSDVEITDFDNVDDTILEIEGIVISSSTTVSLGYDSRNHGLNPTEGSKHRLSFEYAGIGGDVGFNKYTAETGWYFPIFKDLVWFMHGKAGIVDKNADDKLLPDYEKFYLGGINSLRGFDFRGVNIKDVNAAGEETKRGGEAMVQFNFELIIPLAKNIGLLGVVFYDTGNVYQDDIDMGDLRESAGYGIRWFSPLAPIRIEYGHILDPRDDEDDGRWEFTMGGAF